MMIGNLHNAVMLVRKVDMSLSYQGLERTKRLGWQGCRPFGGKVRVFCSSSGLWWHSVIAQCGATLWWRSTVNQPVECATERSHDSVCRDGRKPPRVKMIKHSVSLSEVQHDNCTLCPSPRGSHTSKEILAREGRRG